MKELLFLPFPLLPRPEFKDKQGTEPDSAGRSVKEGNLEPKGSPSYPCYWDKTLNNDDKKNN